jgi:hypothetical protein
MNDQPAVIKIATAHRVKRAVDDQADPHPVVCEMNKGLKKEHPTCRLNTPTRRIRSPTGPL